MKILSRMLSKKIEPQAASNVEGGEDERAELDDAGQVRRSRIPSEALSQPIAEREEEPEVAGSGWAQDGDWDDDWDDDDDWGEEDDPAATLEERRRTADKQHLVSEIREAMTSVAAPSPDEQQSSEPGSETGHENDGGRRARARSQLIEAADENQDRLLEKTETVMSERETSRRRSAMAHMKAAAAATKADRVLRHVASRDTTSDPAEQSPYRDDLAKVVRPLSTSRPISRQVSRPHSASPVWDQGTGDEDAALFAAAEDGLQDDPAAAIDAEMSAEEERRLSRAPSKLTANEFSDDEDVFPEHKPRAMSDFPSSRFAVPPEDRSEEDHTAFDDFEDAAEDISAASRSNDEYDDPFAGTKFDSHEERDDDFTPRPSRAVSEAVAFANATDDELTEEPEPEVRKKIWEMADEVAAEIQGRRDVHDMHQDEEHSGAAERYSDGAEDMLDVSGAVAGRAGRSAGRVKTRLLGFQSEDEAKDVFAVKPGTPAPVVADKFPTGWIIVVDGPGRGASFSLHVGVSNIGRGEDQAVRLDFGDTSISRNNHAAVAFDEELGKFFLGHGGKSNLVRLNGKPVLSTEEMNDGDEIRIGETSLKFVAFCGEDFSWNRTGDDHENA